MEDGWLHFVILRDLQPVQKNFPALQDQPFYHTFPLETLLEYGRAVERSTLAYLATLSDDELKRKVTDEDERGREREYSVDGLLWHVMIHEMRHTAQIAVLLRTQGVEPPSLDLLFYLPVEK